MSGMWRALTGMAVAASVVLACQGPVTLKPASPDASTVQPVESLRGVDSLSVQTQ